MTSYVVDIEAIKEDDVYNAWRENNPDKDFVPPFACKIISMGYAKLNDKFQMEKLSVACVNESEKEGIEHFTQAVAANNAPVVTWNGRSFDLPLVAYRALHYGVPMAWYYEEKGKYRSRYSTERHFDLMDFLSDYGQNKPSLDYVAKLVGLPGKMGTKGADVEQLYREGKLAEIVAYGTTDVIQTYILLLRTLLVRGTIGRDHYMQCINDTATKLKSEGSLDLAQDSQNMTLLGNNIEKPATLAVAKGCRTFTSNWNVQKLLEV
jgi:predicted PolB exonuclease-like 3'-5' exonuclease